MEAGCIRYAIAVIALMLLPDNKGIHLDDLEAYVPPGMFASLSDE
jgi:hypothetical protein